jgi:hypothetical protein
LKRHLDQGVTINCPFPACNRPMHKKTTFTAHMSSKHK